jgi:hypothetical protein
MGGITATPESLLRFYDMAKVRIKDLDRSACAAVAFLFIKTGSFFNSLLLGLAIFLLVWF